MKDEIVICIYSKIMCPYSKWCDFHINVRLGNDIATLTLYCPSFSYSLLIYVVAILYREGMECKWGVNRNVIVGVAKIVYVSFTESRTVYKS